MRNNQKNNEIIDAEFEVISEPNVKIEGITEDDVNKLRPVVQQFLTSYAEKPADVQLETWLENELKTSLADRTEKEISKLSHELIEGVKIFQENAQSLERACNNGQTKEEWLKDRLQAVAKEKVVDMQEYGKYLSLLNQAMTDSNQAMMEAIQSKGGTIKLDGASHMLEMPSNIEWNPYNTAALALNIGKHASLAGIGGAALSTGFKLGMKAARGEDIKGADVISAALLSGNDQEIKSAAAGALQVGIDRGFIPLLPKNLPASSVSNIACLGIENARTFALLADGKISTIQALENVARGSVATVSGLSCEGIGATIGASLLSFVPVVGTTVGGIVGGLVGRMAGSKIGQAIHKGIEKIKPVAVSVAKTTWNAVKSTAKAVGGFVKSAARKIASFLGF